MAKKKNNRPNRKPPGSTMGDLMSTIAAAYAGPKVIAFGPASPNPLPRYAPFTIDESQARTIVEQIESRQDVVSDAATRQLNVEDEVRREADNRLAADALRSALLKHFGSRFREGDGVVK